MRYPPEVHIFTKKNALVGFLALRAFDRARKRGGRKRSAWRLPAIVALGIVSVGVLAIVAAVMLRRHREPEHLQGYVAAAVDEQAPASIAVETEPSQAA
jgi:anti-sigma-K factor RskA